MPILHWYKRENDLTRAALTPNRLLQPVPKNHYGAPDSPNMLIHGEVLDTLKALQPYYVGSVKCIYADLPFNTLQALPDYKDHCEHGDWLSLMYPCLELQRNLLTEDGTLFLHIDDNELGYLVAIADEVMGRKNRRAIVTFKQGSATGHKSINPGLVSTTNYLLVYAKNEEKWNPNRLFTGRHRDTRYNQFLVNPDDDFRKWHFIPLFTEISNNYGKKINVIKKELGAEQYENFVNTFVVENHRHVARYARPDYKGIGKDFRDAVDKSSNDPDAVHYFRRESHPDVYLKGGEKIIFYTNKLKEIDGKMVAGEPLTTLWDDVLSNNLHNEGGVQLKKSKKPEALIKRCLELSTQEGDLVLDAYLGSGTTAATAHKMKRKWIGIERGDHALTKCLLRLKCVVDGEQSGISKNVQWGGGGGFSFYKLGPKIFDERGSINSNIQFEDLATHIWFSETRTARSVRTKKSSLLGVANDTAYYLLFNGILDDKSNSGENVLTLKVLRSLHTHDGSKVIYGEACDISEERLEEMGITFKHYPYDIKAD